MFYAIHNCAHILTHTYTLCQPRVAFIQIHLFPFITCSFNLQFIYWASNVISYQKLILPFNVFYVYANVAHTNDKNPTECKTLLFSLLAVSFSARRSSPATFSRIFMRAKDSFLRFINSGWTWAVNAIIPWHFCVSEIIFCIHEMRFTIFSHLYHVNLLQSV